MNSRRRAVISKGTAEQKPLNPAQQAKAAEVIGREFGELVASFAKAKHDPAPISSTPSGRTTRDDPPAETGAVTDVLA